MGADIYAEVGRRIQLLRKAHGLTQNELAERSDIASSYLVKLEAGTRKARLEVYQRIAEALGEPLWKLFTDWRLTPDEDRWKGEASRLAETVRSLGDEDLRALLAIARQLASRRMP